MHLVAHGWLGTAGGDRSELKEACNHRRHEHLVHSECFHTSFCESWISFGHIRLRHIFKMTFMFQNSPDWLMLFVFLSFLSGNFQLRKVRLFTWTRGIFSRWQRGGPAGEWLGWRWVLWTWRRRRVQRGHGRTPQGLGSPQAYPAIRQLVSLQTDRMDTYPTEHTANAQIIYFHKVPQVKLRLLVTGSEFS